MTFGQIWHDLMPYAGWGTFFFVAFLVWRWFINWLGMGGVIVGAPIAIIGGACCGLAAAFFLPLAPLVLLAIWLRNPRERVGRVVYRRL